MFLCKVVTIVFVLVTKNGYSCGGVQINTKVAESPVAEAFMVNNCQGGHDQKQFVNKSLKVKLLKDTSLEENLGMQIDCSVTFAARRPSQKILIVFENITIDRNDGLRIFDGFNDQIELTDSAINGVYLSSKNRPRYFISKNFPGMTLRYRGTPSKFYDGFTAMLTVMDEPYLNGSCGSEHFACVTMRRKYCITEEVQCDGYNNCQDSSDETSCIILPDHTNYYSNPGSAQNLGMLVGGSVSILILLIVAVWLCIVCVRRIITKREYERRQNLYVSGPVIDADFVPPIAQCSAMTRHQLPLLMPTPVPQYEYTHPPPPYTPDGCDTAELLNQTQGLSLDTPPAYQTLDPMLNFNSNHSLDNDVVDGVTGAVCSGGDCTGPLMVNNCAQVGNSLMMSGESLVHRGGDNKNAKCRSISTSENENNLTGLNSDLTNNSSINGISSAITNNSNSSRLNQNHHCTPHVVPESGELACSSDVSSSNPQQNPQQGSSAYSNNSYSQCGADSGIANCATADRSQSIYFFRRPAPKPEQ